MNMFAASRHCSVRRFSVGAANLDWPKLGFAVQKVAGHVEYTWTEGSGWDKGKFETNPMLNLHVCANVLHYGQALFEGLKGFHCADGKFRVFRDDENCKRMRSGCGRLLLPEVPLEIFRDAVDSACKKNKDYIPPYGSGSSLYIRPFIFGYSEQIGLSPATTAKFMVVVTPVSSYYSGGVTGIDGKVVEEFDRAAPKGTGNVKAAGNYAADLIVQKTFKDQGFPIGLYLDPLERKYVEEFNTSNFTGIKNNTYITPESDSILPSITNLSLLQLAEDSGMKTERRKIEFSKEVESLEEVGAVGTAVVITPLNSITHGSRKYDFKSSKALLHLRDKMQQIHFGEDADKHSWMREIQL